MFTRHPTFDPVEQARLNFTIPLDINPMLVKSVQDMNGKVELLENEKARLGAELKRKEASDKELYNRVSRIERLLSSEENTKSVGR